jgi:hypothetical protein
MPKLQKEKSWTGMRGKTLWDWLHLLIIPVVLSAGLLMFDLAENQRARRAMEEQANESMLQGYLNRIEELLLEEELRSSEPRSEVRNIANKRTVAVLRQLDGTRKRFLLRYLYELGLIFEEGHVITLGGSVGRHLRLRANLNRAKLNGLTLKGAYLTRTDIIGADLRGSNLAEANLIAANLQDADLRDADLGAAKLFSANLSRADLTGANLKGARMGNADLRGAKVSAKQLAEAKSIKGAVLPDGSTHN